MGKLLMFPSTRREKGNRCNAQRRAGEQAPDSRKGNAKMIAKVEYPKDIARMLNQNFESDRRWLAAHGFLRPPDTAYEHP